MGPLDRGSGFRAIHAGFCCLYAAASPADHSPKDKFILMRRLYWPDEKDPSILDGTWKIPQVKAVE